MSVYFDEDRQRWRVQVRFTGRRRVRLSKMLPAGATRSDAEELQAQMEREAVAESYELPTNHGWIARIAEAKADKRSWFWRMLSNATKRGGKNGKGCALTPEELEEICLRSDGKCEVSGIPFSDERGKAARLRPLVPTLDRIDARDGYSAKNCRLVCGAVNVAMFDWGESIFLHIVAGTFYNRFVRPEMARAAPQEHVSL